MTFEPTAARLWRRLAREDRLAAAVCFWRTRHAAAEREERFFHLLFWGVVFVALIFFGVPFFLARSTGPASRWLTAEIDLLFSLAGLFPGLVFAYYVYRYNYLEFVLRRSIFHAFLTLLVICIYYYLIRQLALWLGQRLPLLFALLPGWDSRSSGLSTVEIMPVATCV